jgi:hypothetical protein
MLQGIAPFKLASNMKLPGTDAAYALLMAVFGQTAGGVHAGLLVMNLAAVAAVFLLGRRLFGEAGAWAAAGCYALLSIGERVLGTMGHAEHYVLVPALYATVCLFAWRDTRRPALLAGAGVLYGLAVVMKQPGAAFALFGALVFAWTWRRDWRARAPEALRDAALFGFAGVLPLAVTCLLLWQAGVFLRFWFWTFEYASAYGTLLTPLDGLRAFCAKLAEAIKPNYALWLLALAGAVTLWRDPARRAQAGLLALLLALSVVAVCPGFYFRAHYFVFLLPAVALFAGAAVEAAAARLGAGKAAAVLGAALLISAALQWYFLLFSQSTELLRAMYAPSPFPEAVTVGKYLQDHAKPDARIAVLGSEPEIYFYSRLHSASDHIYTFAFGENQPYAARMQDEMIHDIETVKPEYVVTVNFPSSWIYLPGHCRIADVLGPADCDFFARRGTKPGEIYRWNYAKRYWTPAEGPTRIFDWFSAYGPAHYRLEGVADIDMKTETVFRWEDEARAYTPKDRYFLRIYRRKD